MVHQLRHLLQMTTLNASEAGLRALIQRHLRKTTKSNYDRDKIDFLLVQYFALCAPAKIYHKQIALADVAQVIQPVLGDVEPDPLAWCAPLKQMIDRKSTRLNSSHRCISYAVFCLKKKTPFLFLPRPLLSILMKNWPGPATRAKFVVLSKTLHLTPLRVQNTFVREKCEM